MGTKHNRFNSSNRPGNFFAKETKDHYCNYVAATMETNLNFHQSSSTVKICWGEWPSGLRRCSKNWKVPGSNPLGAQLGLGTQPRYEAPGDLRVENVKKHSD